MSYDIFAVVRYQFEGFHCWPDAKKILPEAGFLSDRHRHMFHVEAKVEQFHDDRDIEFILFRRELAEYTEKEIAPGKELGSKSCEQIALQILRYIQFTKGERRVTVRVFEDGENGAEVSNH